MKTREQKIDEIIALAEKDKKQRPDLTPSIDLAITELKRIRTSPQEIFSPKVGFSLLDSPLPFDLPFYKALGEFCTEEEENQG